MPARHWLQPAHPADHEHCGSNELPYAVALARSGEFDAIIAIVVIAGATNHYNVIAQLRTL